MSTYFEFLGQYRIVYASVYDSLVCPLMMAIKLTSTNYAMSGAITAIGHHKGQEHKYLSLVIPGHDDVCLARAHNRFISLTPSQAIVLLSLLCTEYF